MTIYVVCPANPGYAVGLYHDWSLVEKITDHNSGNDGNFKKYPDWNWAGAYERLELRKKLFGLPSDAIDDHLEWEACSPEQAATLSAPLAIWQQSVQVQVPTRAAAGKDT